MLDKKLCLLTDELLERFTEIELEMPCRIESYIAAGGAARVCLGGSCRRDSVR